MSKLFEGKNMRVELLKLLRTRTLCHPSKFSLLEAIGEFNVRIDVVGYPWWQKNPKPDVDQTISFNLEGILDGNLNYDFLRGDPGEEFLENFRAYPLSGIDWATGEECSIYCRGPLSNSVEIYEELQEFLFSVDCPYGPERFLNSVTLKQFRSLTSPKTSPTSYLLFSGPQSVCQIVQDVLEKSGDKYDLIKNKDLSNGLICVRIGESYLICKTAYAVFDG